MKYIVGVGLVLGLTAFPGCSSGSGSPGGNACSASATCGGDAVGSWTITSSCLTTTETSTLGSCSYTISETVTMASGGTLVVNSDGTFTNKYTSSGTGSAAVPASCLNSGATSTTCAQIAQLPEVSSAFPGVACSNAPAGGCNCTFTIPSNSTTEVGNYAIAGDVVTTTSTGSVTTSKKYTFCVSGNQLTISPQAASAGASESGSIIYTK